MTPTGDGIWVAAGADPAHPDTPTATSSAVTTMWRRDTPIAVVMDQPTAVGGRRFRRARSPVRARLESPPVVRLELEGRVLDVEIAGQALAQEVEDGRAVCPRLEHDVRRDDI